MFMTMVNVRPMGVGMGSGFMIMPMGMIPRCDLFGMLVKMMAVIVAVIMGVMQRLVVVIVSMPVPKQGDERQTKEPRGTDL